MGKRGRKGAKKGLDRRLRAVTTVESASDSSIKPGSKVVLVQPAVLPEVGDLAFAAVWPSRLLAESAEEHLKRALKLRMTLPKQVKTVAGGAKRFTSDALVLDFFQEAIAGLLLLHHALFSFSIEALAPDFVYRRDGEERDISALEGSGIELLLSRVLEQALSKPNLRTTDSDLWQRIMRIKRLRDDIAHPKSSEIYSGDDPGITVFGRLLTEDLAELRGVFQRVLDHFGESR
jgi:hypothetical protein